MIPLGSGDVLVGGHVPIHVDAVGELEAVVDLFGNATLRIVLQSKII